MIDPGLWWGGIVLNVFWQSMVVAGLGVIALKCMARRPAAERALTAMCCLAALLVLPVVGAFAPAGRAIWSHRSPAAVAATALPAAGGTADAARPPVAAALPTAAEVPAWKTYAVWAAWPMAAMGAAGTLWLLFRLFCGLIFLKGFRYGLKPVSDARVDAALAQADEMLHLRHPPAVFASPVADSPLTIGIFRPVMILPERLLDTLTEQETASIVLHEFSHIRRRDHLAGLFKRLLAAIYWWNPSVYRLNHLHSDAAEELADNCALLRLRREDYSECLLRLAEKTGLISHLPAAIGMAARPGGLRQRVLGIMSKERKIEMQTTMMKKFAIAAMTSVFVFLIGGASVAFAENSADPSEPKGSTYWQKLEAWQMVRKGGGDVIRAAELLEELSRGVWLVKFKPVNGFNPRTPGEFLMEFSKCSSARSARKTIGAASFFRTAVSENMLIGSFLSDAPEQLKSDLEKSKTIQFISMEKVTPELFVKVVESEQESLPMTPEQLKKAPRAVATFPAHGAVVDAAEVKEISVTFSKDMNTSGSWAFCTAGGKPFPKIEKEPYWRDNRTCVVAVTLEPGKEYSVWFNLGKYNSFLDREGNPAIPSELVFKTK
jgi:beta-lactamase regulating signal transducer with metallopeptidase domain